MMQIIPTYTVKVYPGKSNQMDFRVAETNLSAFLDSLTLSRVGHYEVCAEEPWWGALVPDDGIPPTAIGGIE